MEELVEETPAGAGRSCYLRGTTAVAPSINATCELWSRWFFDRPRAGPSHPTLDIGENDQRKTNFIPSSLMSGGPVIDGMSEVRVNCT